MTGEGPFDPDPDTIYRVSWTEPAKDGRPELKTIYGHITFTKGGGVFVRREGDTDVFLPTYLKIQEAQDDTQMRPAEGGGGK